MKKTSNSVYKEIIQFLHFEKTKNTVYLPAQNSFYYTAVINEVVAPN